MTDEQQPKQLDFTRDGELVYLQSNFTLLKKKIEQEKLSLKARDKIFLELEALISRYQENFAPDQDDRFLQQMLRTQQLTAEDLGRTFFEQMYQDCVDKFQKESSLTQDRETLTEIIDIRKRYCLISSLGENDPLLLKIDNLAEQIRQEIQGERYLQRLGEQYQQQFLLNKTEPEKCEQIINLADTEYSKLERNYKPEQLIFLKNILLSLKKQYSQMVRADAYQQLQQMILDIKANSSRLDRISNRLKRLAQKVKQYAPEQKELLEQIFLLDDKVKKLITNEQNDLFDSRLSDIQRQLLYSRSEQDYQRVLELLDELRNRIPTKFPNLSSQQLVKYRELYDKVKSKYRELHQDKFKELFAQLKTEDITVQPQLLQRLQFLIKKYDLEYQAQQNKDPFFYEMLEYEKQLKK